MNTSMLLPEKTPGAEQKDRIFEDAGHVPDVSDEALEACGGGSSEPLETQLSTVQKNCCR